MPHPAVPGAAAPWGRGQAKLSPMKENRVVVPLVTVFRSSSRSLATFTFPAETLSAVAPAHTLHCPPSESGQHLGLGMKTKMKNRGTLKTSRPQDPECGWAGEFSICNFQFGEWHRHEDIVDKKTPPYGLVDVDTMSETLTAAGTGTLATPKAPSENDRALASAFRELAAGGAEALEDVWRLCGDDLYRLALWRTGSVVDAEDSVQDVFVRLASRTDRLGAVRNPRAYLLRMAHNLAVDTASHRRHDLLPEDAPSLVTVEPVDDLIDGRRASRLLLELPPKQREVVYLRQFVGLSFREIATVCGVSLFTAASRHRLAINRLRKLMGVEDA
jgi:RNA polymerase sigma-70 factor (ECF subfamily)